MYCYVLLDIDSEMLYNNRRCKQYTKGAFEMAQVNIRIDDELKKKGEELFNELGMSFSTAVSIFVSQAVRQGGIPFEITTKDDFYNPVNIRHLKHSIKQMKRGNVVVKTMDELEKMANE